MDKKPSFKDYVRGRLFARYGFAGWWKIEYETMSSKEVISDLQKRGAPASPLFNALRRY